MSKGRFERKKEKKRASAGKIILIIFAVLLVLIIAAGIAVYAIYSSLVGNVTVVEVPDIVYTTAPTEVAETEPVATTEEATVPTETEYVPSSEDFINILVVGQAARDGEAERFADTMILLTLNKHEKTLTMTSFLRDSFAKMPNYKGHNGGRIKLTTIYHLGSFYSNGEIAGSMELMNQALYDNFGVEVDHNIEVDFDCFVKMVDMVGGLPVELTQEEVDYLLADDRYVRYETLEPGWTCIDGMAALSYVRMRKAEGDGDSDIKRTARQRQAITNLLVSISRLSLSELQDMAEEILPLITTSMSKSEITEMLLLVLPMLPELTIESSGTCPVEGTYWGDMVDIYDDGFLHSVVKFDSAEQKKLMRALTEGEIAE